METSPDPMDLAGCTLLGVWAHPDDEAYLSAGLMARTSRAGGKVVCVHATLGELGTDDPARWPPERLAPHRAIELEQSLSHLGVHEHTVWGYADGACDQVHPDEPIRRIIGLFEQHQPDVVITFGPDGITGHPDHIAVSRWVTAAWCRQRVGALLYATNTASFMRRYRAVHERVGIFGPDAAYTPDEDVTVAVSLTPQELELKRRALAAHASQTTALAAAMGEKVYRNWKDVETFREPTINELVVATMAAAR